MMVARLEFSFFGFPTVSRNNQVIPMPERKALALLAYLAVVGKTQGRDTLATFFWPTHNQRQARANLRYVLWLLKKNLGDKCLEVDRETVGLNREEEIWIDVEQFQELLEQSEKVKGINSADILALHKAVELWRGDFLAGFTLLDSADFDEWQTLQSEQLRGKLAAALEKLVCYHGDQGEFNAAIHYARRWLALDPLHEAAHCQLMRLYARAGQQAAALRQYAECVRLLDEALNTSPAQETTALYQSIRQRQAKSPGDKIADRIALARRTSLSHNLPPQPTRFVGRRVEQEQIAAHLADPDCRLLTVVGAGGVGKTRLALQAAASQAGAFAHGVCFVPLASVHDSERLASAILEALDVSRLGGTETKTVLFNYLQEKQLLLLLDNFEHLLKDVDLLVDMLRHAPGIKLLVTSRERLNLREEWLLPLAGMRAPEADDTQLSVAQIDQYDALQFFVQCVQHLYPDFSLHAADLPFIVQICRLVDGVPLAIELAVPWLRVLSLEAIAVEIGHRLDFLTTTMHNIPERHRSIRAVFDHSWGLLAEHERAVVCQLSVFRGGFTRAAAEIVAGASLAHLSTLVDKSWLHATLGSRYELHELVRQYCAEKLANEMQRSTEGADEALVDEVRDRHSVYYAAFLEQKEQKLKGPKQGEAIGEILAELDNIWAAWHWAVDHRRWQRLGQFLVGLSFAAHARGLYREVVQALDEAATRLKVIQDSDAVMGALALPTEAIVMLARILTNQGRLSIDLGLLEAAARHTAEARTLLRELTPHALYQEQYGFATHMFAVSLYDAGKYEQAGSLYREALTCYDNANAPWDRAWVLFHLGLNCFRQGQLEEAARVMQETLAEAENLGDPSFISASLRPSAQIAAARGDYQHAQEMLVRGLELALESNMRLHVSHTLMILGDVAVALENYAEARQYYEHGLALAQESGDRLGEVACRNGLGITALALGDLGQARELFETSLAICQHVGRRRDAAIALTGLGDVACVLDDYEQARHHFEDALQTAMEIHATPQVLDVLVGMAQLFTKLGKGGQATNLLEYVLNHPAGTRQTKDRADRLLSTLTAGTTTVGDGNHTSQLQSLEQLVADLDLSSQ